MSEVCFFLCVCVGEKVNGVDLGKGVQTAMFDCSSDWDREIKRTGASEWRVCTINEEYLISPRCVCVDVYIQHVLSITL